MKIAHGVLQFSSNDCVFKHHQKVKLGKRIFEMNLYEIINLRITKKSTYELIPK